MPAVELVVLSVILTTALQYHNSGRGSCQSNPPTVYTMRLDIQCFHFPQASCSGLTRTVNFARESSACSLRNDSNRSTLCPELQVVEVDQSILGRGTWISTLSRLSASDSALNTDALTVWIPHVLEDRRKTLIATPHLPLRSPASSRSWRATPSGDDICHARCHLPTHCGHGRFLQAVSDWCICLHKEESLD